jgi:uncharacterized metal-binding protein YceD (DUF177 family)
MLDTEISIDELASGKPLMVNLAAGRGACEEMAQRFGWIDVCTLTAEIKLKSIADGAYHASGQVDAAIIQHCRITGNPVAESIRVEVDERFTTISEVRGNETKGEMEIDPLAVSVEILEGGRIPVGEMVAQLVGLEATPWPRDPAAESQGLLPQDDFKNQFASLAELKRKR